MTPQDVLRQQQQLTPKQSLTEYAGRWVALSGGYVIASAADPRTLRGMVSGDAVILSVPEADGALVV